MEYLVMATKKKKTQNKKNEVATLSKGGLPANLDYGEAAGMGRENMTQDDLSIPWIQLLQSNSPEVDGSIPQRKIEGAVAGMITDNVSRKLRSPEEGIIFVPCATDHKYVEWLPRGKGGGGGAGWVAQYGLHEDIVNEVRRVNKRDDKGILLNPKTGNCFVETYYCIGLILDDPEDTEYSGFAMIAFSSTKIKVYKKGIGELFKFHRDVPLFAHRLRITGVPDKNQKGSFWNYNINPAIEVGTPEENRIASLIQNKKGKMHPIIAAGMKLNQEYNAGKAKIDYAKQGSTEAESEEGAF
jgi:hypothetical protein